jgi:hypothetical protein
MLLGQSWLREICRTLPKVSVRVVLWACMRYSPPWVILYSLSAECVVREGVVDAEN